ncbi:MAG: sigma-70 family RNA polymerase sigma factor [Eubacteriales bacterium]|nr:sigma-70 family RNA polymerase sigma factor [Eubacteriales bacterium]
MKEDKFHWTNQVRLAAKGDPAAWDVLYRATYQNAYFVAIKVIGSEEDAMDLVQDAYITAMENLGRLKEPEKFQSWLNMIVANKCRDQLRKTKPMLFSEIGDENGEEPEWVDDRDSIRPDLVLDQAETVRLVAEIIEALPEDQRLCVTLFYRDELSVGEIAQALEVSEGTVKSRLNYARQKVKAKVKNMEKQGVKLYGIAPIPFFIWLLKNGTEDVPIPVRAAGLAAAGKAAAGGTVKSAAAHAGAAAGTKAGTAAAAAKVVACVAAVSVAMGGALAYAKGHDAPRQNEEAQVETVSHMETSPQELPSAEETVSQKDEAGGISNASANEEAMEAYYRWLRNGYTASDMPIKYYAFLDLDRNGVNELIAADNAGTPETWTACEVYSYKDGSFIFCGETSAHYDYFYYVNGEYLLGRHRMGAQYLSPGSYIATTIYHWNEEGTRNDPAIKRDNGDWEYISQEEFNYYNCPGQDCDGSNCFEKSSEIITLLKNEFVEPNILEETLDFSKCWSIPVKIEDRSTPSDPTPELPYGNWTYFVCFRFYESGNLELLFYKPYTDYFDGYKGYYTVREDEVELTYIYDGNEHSASYRFNPDELTFTQLSENGILNSDKKGMEFQLVEDPLTDIESMHRLVEMSLRHRSD